MSKLSVTDGNLFKQKQISMLQTSYAGPQTLDMWPKGKVITPYQLEGEKKEHVN